MAFQKYTGNSSNSHPSVAKPALAGPVEINQPLDGETPNADALNPDCQQVADWIEFLRSKVAPLKGVRTWAADVTYTANEVVVDADDGHVYKAKAGLAYDNVDLVPHSNPASWDRIDYTGEQIRDISAKVTQALSDITCSNGASVAGSTMISFGGSGDLALKAIIFTVATVPGNSYTDIDMTASATKFATVLQHVVLGLRYSAGVDYGGAVGYTVVSKTILRVWFKKGSESDPNPAATVSVIAFGM